MQYNASITATGLKSEGPARQLRWFQYSPQPIAAPHVGLAPRLCASSSAAAGARPDAPAEACSLRWPLPLLPLPVSALRMLLALRAAPRAKLPPASAILACRFQWGGHGVGGGGEHRWQRLRRCCDSFPGQGVRGEGIRAWRKRPPAS